MMIGAKKHIYKKAAGGLGGPPPPHDDRKSDDSIGAKSLNSRGEVGGGVGAAAPP